MTRLFFRRFNTLLITLFFFLIWVGGGEGGDTRIGGKKAGIMEIGNQVYKV